jgi:flagella basal body P-ring formation protein FlgA
MPVNTLTLFLALCALLSVGTNAVAQNAAIEPGVQSLAAVRRAAEVALRRELDPNLTGVKLEATTLDARLRLAACTAPLETSTLPPRGAQGRVLVRVTCRAGASWTINVPVEIRRETTVLVLRRAIGRGEIIGAADVTVQPRSLPGLGTPYLTTVAELSGRLTRRPVPAGTAVTADALNAALLIHRGQAVTLAVMTAGLEVRAPGEALADATAQQRVRVRNLNSLKIVEGVADTDGVVRVSP